MPIPLETKKAKYVVRVSDRSWWKEPWDIQDVEVSGYVTFPAIFGVAKYDESWMPNVYGRLRSPAWGIHHIPTGRWIGRGFKTRKDALTALSLVLPYVDLNLATSDNPSDVYEAFPLIVLLWLNLIHNYGYAEKNRLQVWKYAYPDWAATADGKKISYDVLDITPWDLDVVVEEGILPRQYGSTDKGPSIVWDEFAVVLKNYEKFPKKTPKYKDHYMFISPQRQGMR